MNENLEGFDESPQQSSNTLSTSKKLHKAHYSEQSEKADTHERLAFLHIQTALISTEF